MHPSLYGLFLRERSGKDESLVGWFFFGFRSLCDTFLEKKKLSKLIYDLNKNENKDFFEPIG